MWLNQYEEHLAHSAPCNSRFDGFDRGDREEDERIYRLEVRGLTAYDDQYEDDIPF